MDLYHIYKEKKRKVKTIYPEIKDIFDYEAQELYNRDIFYLPY